MAYGYEPKEIDGQMHAYYQAAGWFPAKQAKDIEIGDALVFNYGYTETVTGIVKETTKTRVFELTSPKGTIYQKRINKSTYWGIAAN